MVKWSKTPPFHGGNMGSNPVGVTTYGRLAQPGERLPYKQDVGSSILSSPTIDKNADCLFLLHVRINSLRFFCYTVFPAVYYIELCNT